MDSMEIEPISITHIQKNTAQFMNDLLAIPSQMTPAGAVTSTESDSAAALEINFVETFPKLNELSNIWKELITNTNTSTYSLRALLTDAAFHKAINETNPTIDLNITDESYARTMKEKSLITLAAAANDNNIEAIKSRTDISPVAKAREIFCILYKELRDNSEELLTNVPILISKTSDTVSPMVEGGGGNDGKGGKFWERAKKLAGRFNPFERPPTQHASRASRAATLAAQPLPDILSGTEQQIIDAAEAEENELAGKIGDHVTRLKLNQHNQAVLDRLSNAEKLSDYEQLKNNILDKVIPKLPPELLLELQRRQPSITPKQWALVLIKSLESSIEVNAKIKSVLETNAKYNKEYEIIRPRIVVTAPSPSVSAPSSRGSVSPISSQYSPPPKELDYANNFNIQSYILDEYGFNLFDDDESLPDCGSPKITDPAELSNANLSGDTPPNCYTNGNLLRISPWVKHKDKYYLACQACGLPMFPAELKGELLTDSAYNKYTNPFESNQMAPASKDDLLKLAGKTQCDHDAPMAMMYNGLKRVAGDEYPKIGIGSNFCPLHPSCNTKKLNISPVVFWQENNGSGNSNYKWNPNWTIQKDGKDKFPDGPWGNTKESVDKWCKNNEWDPRYYARLLQWKYFSALEELVKGDGSQFKEALGKSISQAQTLYKNMSEIKAELKKVVDLIRKSDEPINIQNIMLAIDHARAGNILTLFQPRGERDKAMEENVRLQEKMQEMAEQLKAANARADASERAHARTQLELSATQSVLTSEQLRHTQGATGLLALPGAQRIGGTRKNKKKRTKQTKRKIIRKKPQKTKRNKKRKKNKLTIKN